MAKPLPPLTEREWEAVEQLQDAFYNSENDPTGMHFPDMASSHMDTVFSTIKRLALKIVEMEHEAFEVRRTAAAMRRSANYALDQWEGEDRDLHEDEQAEVKKLLQEISDTTWPLPTSVFAPSPFVGPYPDVLTPELDEVLGWPNFKCGPYAQLFRAAGHAIPTKAEREQAFVLHWLIKLVIKHGADWAEFAQIDLEALKNKVSTSQQQGDEDAH